MDQLAAYSSSDSEDGNNSPPEKEISDEDDKDNNQPAENTDNILPLPKNCLDGGEQTSDSRRGVLGPAGMKVCSGENKDKVTPVSKSCFEDGVQTPDSRQVVVGPAGMNLKIMPRENVDNDQIQPGEKIDTVSPVLKSCLDDREQTSDPRQDAVGHVGRAGMNFFGLTSIRLPDVDTETAAPGGGSQEQRLVRIHGNCVEVPEGDFWHGFSEAEAEEDLGSRKRKFETPFRSVDCARTHATKTVENDRAFDHRHAQCGPSSAKQTHASRHIHNLTKTNPAQASPLESDFTVKVYAVHPKISPYLNGYHGNQCANRQCQRWAGHSKVINRIAWCGSSAFSHLLLSAAMDSTVRVWNAWGKKTRCVRTLTTHGRAVRDARWSADGRKVLSCSYDSTAALTDVETGQRREQFEHSSFVSAGLFHPVTPHLITTGSKDCIQVWDIRQPEIPVRIMTHKEELGQVQDLLFSHDGRELFSCGDVVTRESADRSIIAWDFRSGVILSNQVYQERYTVTRLCLHPSHSHFLAQTQAGYAAVFSTQRPFKMNKNKRFEGHKTSGYNIGLSLSQDGSLVYSGSSDGKLHCYNFNNSKRIRTLDCKEPLLDVAAHPVLPSVVAGATWDGDIIVFE